VRQAAPGVVWIGLVLAVAAYGAVVVRNVTDTMAGIARHDAAMVMVEQPNR
jgi:uncharacterized membrane protein YqhA